MKDREDRVVRLMPPSTVKRREMSPRPIRKSPADFITTHTLSEGSDLPLVIRPALDGVKLSVWAEGNRSFIEDRLIRHGGLLFRGFEVHSIDDFGSFAITLSGELLEYKERSSPRTQVEGNIYTSTDYPADQRIFLHNENSYQRTWPMKILFFCETPAQQGGETTLADCRKVLRRIDIAIRDRFMKRHWMYVRNFGDGFGLPWETVFLTSNRSIVEDHCRANGIHLEWRQGNRLRLRRVLPVISTHPKTGESVWFNHATFFNVLSLECTIRDRLVACFQEEDLPTNTYYGDGSTIEDSVIAELQDAYSKETVICPWSRGDVLLLDNMLVAHGRNPYVGRRKVLVAMCEPFAGTAGIPGAARDTELLR